MMRISAIEKAMPDDVRRTAREHPFLVIAAGALAGYYLGKSHGRAILSALVSVGITAGASSARRMLGVEPSPRLARAR
ncbi:MAG TPA: hypothetical protein VGS98_12790 [Thermoanaerobaculia bacterium]|jgi:hypothetical protein|nr:hypothetical protein [Thermoanaerobaculia bacterium]